MTTDDGDQLLWIDPKKIHYCTPASKYTDVNQHEGRLDHPHAFHDRGYFQESQRRGTLLPGDWDRATLLFQDLLEFKALRDHIAGSTPWRQSLYAARACRWIASGETSRGYTRANEFLTRRTEEIDGLIRSIQERGVHPAAGPTSAVCSDDDISVNVARNGSLLFNNRGHHRLAIAKLLGVSFVPVQVIIRHAQLRV